MFNFVSEYAEKENILDSTDGIRQIGSAFRL